MNKQISIIGCGWLGLPLAKHLISKGYKLKGSTTSKEKIEELRKYGIVAFYVEMTQDGVKGDTVETLSGSEILILNVPPGLRKHPENDFVKQTMFLMPFIESSTIKTIVFISSTSVYADDETLPRITEDTIPVPDSEAGKQLLKVESLLQNNNNFQTTALRFSGLYGDDRHPAKYLSGKMKVKDPEAPVNLVHLQDCIGVITTVIENNLWNEIFNVATTPHPSKKEFYTSECKRLDLAVPQFDASITSKGKLIASEKLVRLLGYQFKVKLNN